MALAHRSGFSVFASFVLACCGLIGCDGSHPAAPVLAPTPAPQASPSAPRVDGYVRDIASRPLEGAIVEVLDGPHAAASAATNASGAFSFTGSFDDSVRFRATKTGHAASIKTSQAQPCANCARHVDFVLESSGPPVEIAGDYTLTFTADPSCAGIPENLRQRTYLATARRDPASSQFELTILDPPVLHDYPWEGAFIDVAGGNLVMGVGNLHGSPGLIERVAPDAYISFDGWSEGVPGTSGAPTLTAAFDGVIEYCELPAGVSPLITGRYACPAGNAITRAQCVSAKHRFTMTRVDRAR